MSLKIADPTPEMALALAEGLGISEEKARFELTCLFRQFNLAPLPFNGLSAAEAERLAILAEENAEVIKAACKILRHGYSSFNPDRPGDGSNRKQLFVELTDVAGAKQLLVSAGDIPSVTSQELEAAKVRKLRYAHHQEGGQMRGLRVTAIIPDEFAADDARSREEYAYRNDPARLDEADA